MEEFTPLLLLLFFWIGFHREESLKPEESGPPGLTESTDGESVSQSS